MLSELGCFLANVSVLNYVTSSILGWAVGSIWHPHMISMKYYICSSIQNFDLWCSLSFVVSCTYFISQLGNLIGSIQPLLSVSFSTVDLKLVFDAILTERLGRHFPLTSCYLGKSYWSKKIFTYILNILPVESLLILFPSHWKFNRVEHLTHYS